MLPPDNFQEDPVPTVAHRTSPTNLGLYLLSVVAARDFGWIGTVETVERLEATLESMNGLERFRGHFYNWYGTLDLRPLDPKYISSVDSGNLAGHLIALWNACGEMMRRPLIGPRWLAGIGDALDLMRESLSGVGDAGNVDAKATGRRARPFRRLAATGSHNAGGYCGAVEGACARRHESRRHRAKADRRATTNAPVPKH